ncbi:LuxR C-terminal-related transcriptional regulator, partial [Methylobacterium crusticola]|uniref:LuxR C-terminal-related transcriptional regulator n=1 Tax=Methylobacterium crusticola TaxID=1697972 RepID=UPI001EE3650A
DEELGRGLHFAYHHEFGYLTCCPTNVGTGLRASALLHLAGLVLTKEIARALRLSPESVRSHLESLYAMLEARNRVEALSRARSLGFLPRAE